MYYHLVVTVRSTSHINEKRSACVGGWECSGCHPGFLGLSVQLGGLMAI